MSIKETKLRLKMSESSPINLRNLVFSPDANPLMEGTTIPTKKGRVHTGVSTPMVNTETGELAGVSAIMKIEEKDDREFVKVFSAGVKATFNLTRTAHRVFQAILDVYQHTRMTRGYADSIYLAWFDEGLCGEDIGMSEKTFQRGLKELLQKGFLAPKAPNLFWVNPSLFFKGDVVRFVQEYKRKPALERDPNTYDFVNGKPDNED